MSKELSAVVQSLDWYSLLGLSILIVVLGVRVCKCYIIGPAVSRAEDQLRTRYEANDLGCE